MVSSSIQDGPNCLMRENKLSAGGPVAFFVELRQICYLMLNVEVVVAAS